MPEMEDSYTLKKKTQRTSEEYLTLHCIMHAGVTHPNPAA